MLSFLASVPSAAVRPGEHSETIQELYRLLEKKTTTTDNIMAALEPIIEMPQKKILNEIKMPVMKITGNTFCLFISAAEFPKKDEKFLAFYGIPVSSLFLITSHTEYIHHMGNVTGRGSTPHDALIDLVKKLVANGLIDPGRLVGKLLSTDNL
jgi:hypothetical protein